jgi:hypothetical protein
LVGVTVPLDPAAIVAEFVERVAPYDPSPEAAPVALLGLRTAHGDAVFPLGDHVVKALCRAIEAYRDPADLGTCVACGSRRLDGNLHCRDCGRLHGILGEVIARHARRVAEESAREASV